MSQDNIFDEKNKVKSQFVSWGKVGDWFKGTLLSMREVNSTLEPGKKNKIYEFRAHGGEFHDLDENKQPIPEAIIVVEGDLWSVGGRASIDNQMRNVKQGTIIGMKFSEVKPAKTKGYNPAKIVNIYIGGLDPNYMGEGVADLDLGKVQM